jgi:hypothetical protein
MRHFLMLPAIVSGCFAMTGCSWLPTDTRAAFESTSDMAPAAQPMAQLPAAAGEQIAVLQSNLQGPLTQKIVLQGDPATGGENRISVTVDLDEARRGEPDYNAPKPTEERINKELDDNLPGIAMTISPNWVRNDFGPFGYAIGRAYGGVTCIYAWQWAPGQTLRLIASPETQAAEASQPKYPTSVRVRLCKQGMGERELVELVHQMAVYPPGSTTPYLDTTYGPRPLVNGDALSSAGVPRAFYYGGVDPGATIQRCLALSEEGDTVPLKHRCRHKHHAHRHDDQPMARETYEPVNVPPLAGRGVSVPLPGEADKSASGGSNPLLAPLQHMQAASAPRAGHAPGDLPLPPPAVAATAPAQAATPAAPSSLPLPE